ncbi:uncharacterized protein LOC113003753 isoform X2 [Solenopsis invicta]|uniref:uncharacterized protein LOC113003753 isoform X2 n=1 Tax=Solenopsis invicta TaxID=13686 RepID=UPI00193E09A3|nr:uncharacterized protein LOC113003753 isoform X2 [Solenopsis invicta]
MLPPIPKLNESKSTRPLCNKMDKMDINVSHEILQNKNTECRNIGIKLLKDNTEKHKSKSATTALEEIYSLKKFSSAKGCKMKSKTNHKCAYSSDGEVTLESLADAICHLNAEILSYKLILRKIDKNIESFLKCEILTKSHDKPTDNVPPSVHILNEFPIRNTNDLKTMERKLKKDETFYSAVVDALHSEIKGASIQKVVNSVLRIILDDKMASSFNWKGQRGTKLKLSNRRISKLMIAVGKEFPSINETIFGRKAGPWLAQATFRIKNRHTFKEAPDDNSSESNSSKSNSSKSDVSEDEDNEHQQ